MGKKYDKAFSKTIALALALLLASTSMTGCSLFTARQDETQSEVMLEAPEPDEEDPGEDLEDESEVEAQVDSDIEAEDETEEVVEEPESTDTPSSAASNKTEDKSTADAVVKEDQFIDTSAVFGKNEKNKTQQAVTTSALMPESVVQPEKVSNLVYEPVGEEPIQRESVKLLAQPTAAAPLPVSGKSYSSARFSKKGSYSESRIYKNGYIDAGNITLSNKTFTGDLHIEVSSGTVTLKNVDVRGNIYVKSGSDWVKLYDTNVGGLVIENNNTSRVFASRDTRVGSVTVKSNAVLEEGGLYSGSDGFKNVTVNAAKGATLTLKNLKLNKLKTVTACDVVYDNDTIINYLYANAATELYGYGQINRLYCKSNGVYYDTKPLYIETGRGYAAPSKRTSGSSGSGSTEQKDKKVTLYDINSQYLNIGDTKIIGVDHNGSSLKVTTSNSSVARITYSNAKNHITIKGLKAGRTTIKVTSSRSGYESATISFNVTIKENGSSSIQLAGISNQRLDVGSTRYVSVNTDASRISVSNSDTSVADVTADGFQLRIRAKRSGTATIKVTASRSGRPSKSTTFKVYVNAVSSNDDYVTVKNIDNQIMNRGSERIVNVNTNGTSIKVTSSDNNVARVSTRWNDALVVEAVNPGSAWITVVASRRGYRDNATTFRVDVYGETVTAPTVNLNYAGGAGYASGSWSNQNVVFTLTGYSSNRTAYSYERPAGGTSSQWTNRQQLSSGTLTVSAEGEKDYYFFTSGNGGNSDATGVYTVRIDKTNPTINVTGTTQNVLTFTASDDRSGISSVVVKDSAGVVYTPSYTNGSYSFTAPAAGKYTAFVTDKAGNIAKSGEFELQGASQPDTEKPVITLKSTIDQTGWKKVPADVPFTVTDNSGVKEVKMNGTVLTPNASGVYSFKADKQGKNEYTITAIDSANNQATQTIKYHLDTDAPTIDSVTTSGTTVIVKVSDAASGVNSIKVVEKGTTTEIPVTRTAGTNNFTFIAEQGKTYTITAMDGAGNISEDKEYTSTAATPAVPSTVQISEPTVSSASEAAQSKAVSFTVTPSIKEGESLKVSVTSASGKDVAATKAASAENAYSFEATETGIYTITVSIMKGTEVVGTPVTKTVAVTNIDNTKPSIVVTGNENGVVDFTVTDEHPVTVLFENQVNTSISENTYKVTGVGAGTYTIKATDSAGNTATQNVTVVQKEAPTVDAQSENLTSTDRKTAQTTIAVDAHGSKISSVSVNKSGAALKANGNDQYQFTATENGDYTVSVLTEDGTSGSTEISVKGISEDKTPPTIQIGEQKANETFTKTELPLTITDADSSAADIVVTADKGTLTGSNGSYLLTVTENGDYTITARDKDNNTATVTVHVENVKGNIAPSISADAANVSGKTAVIPFAVSDNGGTAIASVTDQNGNPAALQQNGSYLLTVHENGSYVVTVKNIAGKTASATVEITDIDSTAPVIAQPDVTYSADKKTANIALTVTDSVDGSTKGVSGVASVSFAGSPMETTGSAYHKSVTENGTYVITATDKAGNSATMNVTVSGIDKTAPTIQVTSKNDTWKKQQVVTFSATDENSGIASAQASKGTAALTVNEQNGYSFTAAENGTYTILVKDRAGNESKKEVTISTVDKTAPATPELKNKDAKIPKYEKGKEPYQAAVDTFNVSYAKAAAGESPVTVKVKIDKETEFKTLSADNMKVTLKEGTHTVVLKAVDAAGNESAAVTYQINVAKKQAAASDKTDETMKQPEEQDVSKDKAASEEESASEKEPEKSTEEKQSDNSVKDESKETDPLPAE